MKESSVNHMNNTIPTPGDTIEGQIVIASCYYNDDLNTVLLLDPTKPGSYYGIFEYDGTTLNEVERYSNIVASAPLWSDFCGFDLPK